MRRTLPASPSYVLLACALAAGTAHADGPLRGNPVDSLPPMERPASANQPPPVVQAPTPEQLALQARLAQRIVPRHFDVSGVHAMPFEEVSALLSPLSGKEISLGELVQHVDKITQLYRDRGYPLSFALVQNQDFANGLVVVTVVEGHIGSVRINGDLGNAKDRLESLAQRLKEEKPLRQATLERVLNLMRTVPGVTFTPSLDLPRRADGATELVLEASRQPVSLTGGVAELGGHAAAGQCRHQQPDAAGRTDQTDSRRAFQVGRRQIRHGRDPRADRLRRAGREGGLLISTQK